MLPLWLALQLGALGMGAGRVPLSGRFPQPAEGAATVEMLAVQIIASSLLFPGLFKNFSRWALAAASAWPMLRLAALLGGEDVVRVYAAAGYVTVWLATLAVWRWALGTERNQMIGVAAAALWAIGGPVLLYLHGEYGGSNEVWPAGSAVWGAMGGPVWGGLARLGGGGTILPADLPLVAILLLGIIFGALCFFRPPRRADKLST
jgi:hypothetical protein